MEGLFENAEQIFIKNCREKVNFQAGFKCKFDAVAEKEYELHITGATLYSIYFNGEFIFYGPARAAHGYLRVDTLKLQAVEGENVLCISIAGYNCPSYGNMNHKSFIQAEIFESGISIKYTGRDFSSVPLNKLREEKVYRYSYQRAFTEVWYLDNHSFPTNWMEEDFESAPICAYRYDETLIPRGFEKPDFQSVDFGDPVSNGFFEQDENPVFYRSDHLVGKNYTIVCYAPSEIRHSVLTDVQGRYIPDDQHAMNEKRYAYYDYGKVNTGFICANITAEQDSEIYIIFSEKPQEDGRLELKDTPSVIKYELKASSKSYDLQAFEAYSLRYLMILVKKGCIRVNSVGLREYSYPISHNTTLEAEDEKLCKIFDSARETFRQNTLDGFLDCPGRERGLWLCDSYFTGQAEQIFAGKGVVEEQFLKNFMMAKEFPGIPVGLIPHNYPSENCGVIPQWIMWYILEVEEYLKRRKDDKEIFRDFCYQYLGCLQKYERNDGLLKKLDGWNFIEWSEANDYVERADVSYPTNMLYARVLEVIGTLYHDTMLCGKAKMIKDLIVAHAFNGTLFCDGAIWNGAEYVNMPEVSEACQYYAVFCGVADERDEKFHRFFEYFYDILGYERKKKQEYPEIAYSNLFIGMTVRFECLLKKGRYEQLLDEIKAYYGHMAEQTNTLWEHDSTLASLNHGLSSVAGVLIVKALTGIIDINEADRIITVDHQASKTVKYQISVGLNQGSISVGYDGSERNMKVSGPYTLQYIY